MKRFFSSGSMGWWLLLVIGFFVGAVIGRVALESHRGNENTMITKPYKLPASSLVSIQGAMSQLLRGGEEGPRIGTISSINSEVLLLAAPAKYHGVMYDLLKQLGESETASSGSVGSLISFELWIVEAVSVERANKNQLGELSAPLAAIIEAQGETGFRIIERAALKIGASAEGSITNKQGGAHIKASIFSDDKNVRWITADLSLTINPAQRFSSALTLTPGEFLVFGQSAWRGPNDEYAEARNLFYIIRATL